MDQAERTMLTAGGRKVPVLMTVRRAVLEGRARFTESFIDLSDQLQAEQERKRLQTQLRQAQKMEALGTLAGGIAHDVNNILSAVLGYSELGLQDTGGLLSLQLEPGCIDSTDDCGVADLPDGPYLRIAVADTGTAIDPAIIDRIFDPYFTTKDKGKGAGLGLAAGHGFVKQYGGGITVDSRLGKAPRFLFGCLPARSKPASATISRSACPVATNMCCWSTMKRIWSRSSAACLNVSDIG